MLFQLNSKDYTRKIRQGTYTINSYDSYTEWTDANYKLHRNIVRSQILGSFTMYFGNQSEYQTFLDDIESSKVQPGVTRVGLWSNNRHEWHGNIEVFIDFTPAREQKIIGEAWFPELKVTIKEC